MCIRDRNYTISDSDLCGAAHSLRPQLDALNGAGEGVRRPTIDSALSNVVKDAVKQLSTADEHGDGYSEVKEFDAEGNEVE